MRFPFFVKGEENWMIRAFEDYYPQLDEDVFMAETAAVIGRVTLRRGVSVWDFAVLRGDLSYIFVDEFSNIQESVVIHVDDEKPVVLGKYITVGHSAVLHGCKIGDNSLIGMGAVILDNAVIGENSIIGAEALIPEGKEIPPGSLMIGIPGKVVQALTLDEIHSIRRNADLYYQLSKKYRR